MIDLTLHRICHPGGRYSEDAVELTDPHYETIIATIESGFLEFPESSLAEVAD